MRARLKQFIDSNKGQVVCFFAVFSLLSIVIVGGVVLVFILYATIKALIEVRPAILCWLLVCAAVLWWSVGWLDTHDPPH